MSSSCRGRQTTLRPLQPRQGIANPDAGERAPGLQRSPDRRQRHAGNAARATSDWQPRDHTSRQPARGEAPAPIGRVLGVGRGQARGTVGRRRPWTQSPFCEVAVPRWRFWGGKPLLLLRLGVSAAAAGSIRRPLLVVRALWSLPASRGLRPSNPAGSKYRRRGRAAPLLSFSRRRASCRPARGPRLLAVGAFPAGRVSESHEGCRARAPGLAGSLGRQGRLQEVGRRRAAAATAPGGLPTAPGCAGAG